MVTEVWFAQDITQPIEVQHCKGVVFTNDNNGNKIGVRLFNGTAAYAPGGSVTCYVIRSDGVTVNFDGTVSNNALSATLPATALTVPGQISIVLQSVSGSTLTTVFKGMFGCEQGTTGTIVAPSVNVSSLAELTAALAGKVSKSGDTMTGALTFVSNGSFGVDIKTSASGARGLSMRFAEASDAERTYFYQFKADNTHYDIFRLPATATAETSNSNYDILTTRTDVLTVTGANGATVSDNASKRVGTLTMLAFRVTLPSSGTGWVRVATYAEGVLGTVTMYDRVVTASGAVAPLQINESGLSVYMSSGLQSQQIIICTTLIL